MSDALLITGRFDINNWENNALPKAGDVVSFSESFEEFNLNECTSTADQCQKGGVVLVKAPKGKTVAEIQVTKLVLPVDGKLEFAGDTVMTLVDSSSAKSAPWKERPHQYDFNCAANWVVTGTTSNPNFGFPCYLDTAIFSDVGFFAFRDCSSPVCRATRTWSLCLATRTWHFLSYPLARLPRMTLSSSQAKSSSSHPAPVVRATPWPLVLSTALRCVSTPALSCTPMR